MIKKTMITFTIISLLSSPAIFAWAEEDYPAGYLGPGHRKYLKNKIRQGYYVEVFVDLEGQQEERVRRKNQIEQIVSHSYYANAESGDNVFEGSAQRIRNSREINRLVEQYQNQSKQVATVETEFSYVRYSDGRIARFTDGLATTIENERIIDEFGNLSRAHTYNMLYNGKRLLIAYEARSTDNLGNTTYAHYYGITYGADSVFYGDHETTANRNEMEKYIKETDSAGNVSLIHWHALNYDGKLLRSFHQEIENSVYGNSSFTRSNIIYENDNYEQMSSYHEEGVGANGLNYSLEQANITYNSNNTVTGYHQEKTIVNIDGTETKTITDAQFTYLAVADEFGPDIEESDPDRLLKSNTTITIINLDGSQKTELITTTYNYDAAQQLTSTSGNSTFSGQEANWWQYTDKQGRFLSRTTDEQGNTIYVYTNAEGTEIEVPAEEITAALKDGNTYSGSSDIQYEILFGRPAYSQIDSTVSYYNSQSFDLLYTETSTTAYTNGLKNNLPRVLNALEHTEVTYASTVDLQGNHQKHTKDIITVYSYAGNGNLIDAQGSGTGSGYELTDQGWMEYDSIIEIDYEEYLGEAKETESEETKNYQVGTK
ncbi:MAG: hypothetical protein U9R31_03995 [Candidatus Omnitrophota bacterium]|nr:hypothetical protein [Candidatus Omnitrophota bacterium]